MCDKKGIASLFQSESGIKVLLLEFRKDIFEIASSQPFKGLIHNKIVFVSKFKYDEVDDLLLLLKPDILLYITEKLNLQHADIKIASDNGNFKVLNIEENLCIACQADEENLQKYYSILLYIEQIKTIKSKLNVD